MSRKSMSRTAETTKTAKNNARRAKGENTMATTRKIPYNITVKSVFERVNERMYDLVKTGNAPWLKPWKNGQFGSYNIVTGRSYNLINQLYLAHSPYNDPKGKHGYVFAGDLRLTKEEDKKKKGYKPTLGDKGVRIKKDSDGNYMKPEYVVGMYYKTWLVTDKEGKPVLDDDGNEQTRTYPKLRAWAVYWEGDLEWGNVRKPSRKKARKHDPIKEGEEVIGLYSEREQITVYDDEPSDKAYYNPREDYIKVPMLNQFKNPNEYYSTVFHEMIHSTGHPSRLDRLAPNFKFGDHNYSQEELVAELGASYLCAKLGIETDRTFKNSASYIQSWLKALKSDEKFFYKACGQAEKAVNFILAEQGGY